MTAPRQPTSKASTWNALRVQLQTLTKKAQDARAGKEPNRRKP
jgi:hypothetical protein